MKKYKVSAGNLDFVLCNTKPICSCYVKARRVVWLVLYRIANLRDIKALTRKKRQPQARNKFANPHTGNSVSALDSRIKARHKFLFSLILGKLQKITHFFVKQSLGV
jgi:hypothetical protein